MMLVVILQLNNKVTLQSNYLIPELSNKIRIKGKKDLFLRNKNINFLLFKIKI